MTKTTELWCNRSQAIKKRVSIMGSRSITLHLPEKSLNHFKRKKAVSWNVTPRGSYKNRRFGGKHRLNYQGDKNRRARYVCSNQQPKHYDKVFLRSERRLLVTANVPTSPIPVTLITDAIHSSETSVLTRSTRSNSPGDGILHSHLRENLRSCISKRCCVQYFHIKNNKNLLQNLSPNISPTVSAATEDSELLGLRTSSTVRNSTYYELLVGKPEGKRPLGRPRRRWIDNIKMDLLEIGVNVLDWIGLAQDR
jgi:hypothetical protein